MTYLINDFVPYSLKYFLGDIDQEEDIDEEGED